MHDISCSFDINEVYPNQSTMKVIIVALALVALAAAAPTEYKEPPKILRSEFDQKPDGYSYGFDSEDGTSRQEEGKLEEIPDEENKLHPVITVRGSYTYVNSEGKQETVTYEADQKGYRAFGDSIPKPPSRR